MTGTGKQSQLVRGWNRVAAPAAWLLASFGFVLSFSIRISAASAGPHAIIGLAGIVVAVGIAVLTPIVRARWHVQALPSRSIWLIGCLLIFVAAWIAFDHLVETWTCPFTRDARLVVGTEPTAALLSYISKSPDERTGHPGACRMVMEFAGSTEDMYQYGGLATRYYILIALHLLAWLALAAVVVTTVESLALGLARRRVARAAPSGKS